MINRFTTLCCFFVSILAQAQIPVGAWRDHLSYKTVIDVEEYNNQIIALTDRALFIHDISQGSNRRISKVNGLSGVDMLALEVDKNSGTILIGYESGVFDVISNGNITNIRDIARSNVLGDRGVYNFFFHNQLVYLSTGFGIVVFDLVKNEIKETYFIGPNGDQLRVNDVVIYDNKFFAATHNGVYTADINEINLTDFRNWNRLLELPNANQSFRFLEVFDNKLFLGTWPLDSESAEKDLVLFYDGTNWTTWQTLNNTRITAIKGNSENLILASSFAVNVYNKNLSYAYGVGTYQTTPEVKNAQPVDAMLLANNELWIADRNYGLVRWSSQNGIISYIIPFGPTSNDAVQIKMYNDNLWAASGAVDGTWNNTYSLSGFYSFVNESWSSFVPRDIELLKNSFDFISVEIDPQNPEHVWMGSWGAGLFEIKNGEVVTNYTVDNSPLGIDVNRNDADFTKIGGMTYDADGNLWMTNPQCNSPLKVLTAGGEWYSFEMGNELPTEFPLSEIIITEAGYKWILRPRKKGLFVFDDNGTISNKNDDRWKEINTEIGNGELPTLSVNSVRLDLDGEMWLGTADGIAVFYSPDEVFDNENFKAEQILIEQEGNVQILLESEVVTSIEIDGANRKWVGTQASGVYLLSSDGTKQIYHFTTENSPLLNNEISDIALNHGNGEVYFSTSDGIISFKGTATTGLLENSEPFVYPNPVPPGYEGVIAVKNLVANSYFKVIDIAGNMIYEGQTEGGQAIWNGKNYQGEKVETGVYLFLITNDTGKQTSTAKVLVTK
jgi:hypothetical protein